MALPLVYIDIHGILFAVVRPRGAGLIIRGEIQPPCRAIDGPGSWQKFRQGTRTLGPLGRFLAHFRSTYQLNRLGETNAMGRVPFGGRSGPSRVNKTDSPLSSLY